MSQQPTPVADDLHATAAQLLARAAQDRAAAQTAARTKQAAGGTEIRQGILPGGGTR
ncbi:hypothetical protein ABZT03_38740 [Streptomyces sp. NPDC005574]|uniref:hypothetical protein n=1 Tax=Streptomyces sp. NPDC005574 TaxID=3156891 RepID=UPI0033AF9D7B